MANKITERYFLDHVDDHKSIIYSSFLQTHELTSSFNVDKYLRYKSPLDKYVAKRYLLYLHSDARLNPGGSDPWECTLNFPNFINSGEKIVAFAVDDVTIKTGPVALPALDANIYICTDEFYNPTIKWDSDEFWFIRNPIAVIPRFLYSDTYISYKARNNETVCRVPDYIDIPSYINISFEVGKDEYFQTPAWSFTMLLWTVII